MNDDESGSLMPPQIVILNYCLNRGVRFWHLADVPPAPMYVRYRV